jgi:hypothetical protein
VGGSLAGRGAGGGNTLQQPAGVQVLAWQRLDGRSGQGRQVHHAGGVDGRLVGDGAEHGVRVIAVEELWVGTGGAVTCVGLGGWERLHPQDTCAHRPDSLDAEAADCRLPCRSKREVAACRVAPAQTCPHPRWCRHYV